MKGFFLGTWTLFIATSMHSWYNQNVSDIVHVKNEKWDDVDQNWRRMSNWRGNDSKTIPKWPLKRLLKRLVKLCRYVPILLLVWEYIPLSMDLNKNKQWLEECYDELQSLEWVLVNHNWDELNQNLEGGMFSTCDRWEVHPSVMATQVPRVHFRVAMRRLPTNN